MPLVLLSQPPQSHREPEPKSRFAGAALLVLLRMPKREAEQLRGWAASRKGAVHGGWGLLWSTAASRLQPLSPGEQRGPEFGLLQ